MNKIIFYIRIFEIKLMEGQQKRCKRHGCLKHYKDEQNSDTACLFHPGQPIFHDLKKGWTCCNKVVYDWDEFQKLPTCAVGRHTDNKEEAQGFFKSSTVSNADKALKKEQAKAIVIKNIDEYNKDFEKKKKQEEALKPKQKKQFLTKDGKFKCINQGCLKAYLDKQNTESACNYHKGSPIFHDLKKYWTCCGKETYDWDEFQKLPTCCVGWHSPKLV